VYAYNAGVFCAILVTDTRAHLCMSYTAVVAKLMNIVVKCDALSSFLPPTRLMAKTHTHTHYF
jgi:hypothetical protein